MSKLNAQLVNEIENALLSTHQHYERVRATIIDNYGYEVFRTHQSQAFKNIGRPPGKHTGYEHEMD